MIWMQTVGRPLWFKALVSAECLFQLPFFFYAIRAFRRRGNRFVQSSDQTIPCSRKRKGCWSWLPQDSNSMLGGPHFEVKYTTHQSAHNVCHNDEFSQFMSWCDRRSPFADNGVRIPAIVYAAHALTQMLPILATIFLDPATPKDRTAVLRFPSHASYSAEPMFAFFLQIFWIMQFGSHVLSHRDAFT